MPYHPPKSMLNVLRDLRLTTGLQVCLDAGDSASYTSGQSWLDTSGNGYDFFLGATVASEASDPTFNGVAGGLSSSEYFSFDGGDYFRYDTTNESWMQTLHQDNAVFSAVAWLHSPVGAGTKGIFGTRGATAGNTGFVFLMGNGSTKNIEVQCHNAGVEVLKQNTTATYIASEWFFAGVSITESNSSGGFFVLNGTTETFDPTYTAPSSGNASFTMEIGSTGNANTPLLNTARMGAFAMWNGVALTAAQLLSIYQYPPTVISGHTSIQRPTRVMEY